MISELEESSNERGWNLEIWRGENPDQIPWNLNLKCEASLLVSPLVSSAESFNTGASPFRSLSCSLFSSSLHQNAWNRSRSLDGEQRQSLRKLMNWNWIHWVRLSWRASKCGGNINLSWKEERRRACRCQWTECISKVTMKEYELEEFSEYDVQYVASRPLHRICEGDKKRKSLEVESSRWYQSHAQNGARPSIPCVCPSAVWASCSTASVKLECSDRPRSLSEFWSPVYVAQQIDRVIHFPNVFYTEHSKKRQEKIRIVERVPASPQRPAKTGDWHLVNFQELSYV